MCRDEVTDLEKQGGLSNAGITPQKGKRPGHNPASQDSIELFERKLEPLIRHTLHLGEWNWRGRSGRDPRKPGSGSRGSVDRFYE
jgi:hypothetical protein